jgi:hypothetical protein
MAELRLATAAVADAGAFLARLVRLDPAALVRLRSDGADRRGAPGPLDGLRRVELWGRVPWEPLVTRVLYGALSGADDVTVAAADLLGRLAQVPGRRGRRGEPDAAGGGSASHPAWDAEARVAAGGGSVAPPAPDAEAGGDVSVALPAARDAQWRWSLPPGRGASVVEALPAAQVRRLVAAAEQAVRSAVAGNVARGARVGERVVRDAMLDHVPIVVEADRPGSLAGDGGTEPDRLPDVSNATRRRVEVPQRLVQAVVRMGFVRSTGDPGEPEVRVLIAGKFVGLGAEYGVTWYRSPVEPGARLIL